MPPRPTAVLLAILPIVTAFKASEPPETPADPPPAPKVSEAELEAARLEDRRRQQAKETEHAKQARKLSWATSEFDNPGWLQVAPGIGTLSVARLPDRDEGGKRNLFGWSAAIAGGRILALKKTLLGLGGSFRVHAPPGTEVTLTSSIGGSADQRSNLAIVSLRPAIDVRWGANFGNTWAYVGMSHGLVVEVPSDVPVLASYSPGWMSGLAILVWRNLFLGVELNLFLHDVRYAGGTRIGEPESVGQKGAAAISFDLALGWRFP